MAAWDNNKGKVMSLIKKILRYIFCTVRNKVQYCVRLANCCRSVPHTQGAVEECKCRCCIFSAHSSADRIQTIITIPMDDDDDDTQSSTV